MMKTKGQKGLRFLVSGGMAFGTDVMVLYALTQTLAIPPLVARVMSIGMAMVVGWLAHRHITFQVKARPTVGEFGHYVFMAANVALLNYGIYAMLLMWRWVEEPVMATAAASVTAMVASYVWMRFVIFRNRI